MLPAHFTPVSCSPAPSVSDGQSCFPAGLRGPVFLGFSLALINSGVPPLPPCPFGPCPTPPLPREPGPCILGPFPPPATLGVPPEAGLWNLRVCHSSLRLCGALRTLDSVVSAHLTPVLFAGAPPDSGPWILGGWLREWPEVRTLDSGLCSSCDLDLMEPDMPRFNLEQSRARSPPPPSSFFLGPGLWILDSLYTVLFIPSPDSGFWILD